MNVCYLQYIESYWTLSGVWMNSNAKDNTTFKKIKHLFVKVINNKFYLFVDITGLPTLLSS